jgi:zinc/manganese transport system ATP-binding protein
MRFPLPDTTAIAPTVAAAPAAPTVAADPFAPARPSVRLHGARVMYDDQVSLDDVTVGFTPGQMTALAGSNGSGKSTLLGAIAGVVPLAAGTIDLDGDRVAYVAQRSSVPDHLPLSVRQVVEMGRWSQRGAWGRLTREDREIVEGSIVAVGLAGLERRPLGALSGGQRQRALVAQGLAQRSQILLLDEPTVGLDDEACDLIAIALAAEAGCGVTVIHATHDPDVIAAAHRVLRLEKGRLLPTER